MKWLFGFLLLLCAGFFAFMQWGATEGKDGGGPQPQPPLNADKIVLLPAESAPAAVSAPVSIHAASAPVAAAEAPAVCMEWGEFTGEELARANTAMAGLKLGSMLSRREVEHPIGYWVYIPPPKTAAEAEKKVAQLKALGVEEYFVIQDEGKWRNAISLGMFKTADAAHNFLKSLEAKGVVSARAGERMGKRTFTVFVLKNPDAALTAKMALLQKSYPESQLKAAACQ